jgi:hypothetical protein
MEHLDTRGRKRGSRKQRLHHWRAMYVQRMVTQKAHRERIRVSTVCAWNTSRLAFDGTGRHGRGEKVLKAPRRERPPGQDHRQDQKGAEAGSAAHAPALGEGKRHQR